MFEARVQRPGLRRWYRARTTVLTDRITVFGIREPESVCVNGEMETAWAYRPQEASLAELQVEQPLYGAVAELLTMDA